MKNFIRNFWSKIFNLRILFFENVFSIYRTDKPDKEKGSKGKDKTSSSRPSKPRRDRNVQQSDDEDEEGGKDTASRQDVNIDFLLTSW